MSSLTIDQEQRSQGLTARKNYPTLNKGLDSYLPVAHGTYYLATGLWPLISSRTFQMITGPKYDVWLVKTTGLLISVIGSLIALSGFQKQPSREITALAIGSSIALGVSDIVYTAKKRISPVYLLDALAEIVLVIGWIFLRMKHRIREESMGEARCL